MAKEKCDCGNVATWMYMPGYGKDQRPFHCEKCVHRGCSCNWRYVTENDEYSDGKPTEEDKPWKWIVQEETPNNHEIKEGSVWTNIDSEGREYPCVEYSYEEKGYDVPTFFSDMIWNITWNWFLLKESFKKWWKRNISK